MMPEYTEMNHGKAMAIVKQINSDKFTDEEKAYAIYLVMDMPTIMSITKAELVDAIKWLWHRAYEFETDVEEMAGEG